MAHFLCHLGCSHFGALLLDFYFTENTFIWVFVLCNHTFIKHLDPDYKYTLNLY